MAVSVRTVMLNICSNSSQWDQFQRPVLSHITDDAFQNIITLLELSLKGVNL